MRWWGISCWKERFTDPVGGVDLGLDLAADGRLIPGVGHQHRVAKRSERPSDWDRLVRRSEHLDGGQALHRSNQGTVWCNSVGLEPGDRSEDCLGQMDRGLGPLGGAHDR
jgi:hypothetical protein